MTPLPASFLKKNKPPSTFLHMGRSGLNEFDLHLPNPTGVFGGVGYSLWNVVGVVSDGTDLPTANSRQGCFSSRHLHLYL